MLPPLYSTYIFKTALSIAVASFICLMAINFLHIEYGFFAILAITVVASVFPNHIADIGLQRLLGSMAAFIIQALTLGLTASLGTITFVSVCAIAVGGYFFSKQYWPYFCAFFVITHAFMYYFSFNGPSFALAIGLLWLMGIAFGVLVVFVVHEFFIQPVPKSAILIQQLKIIEGLENLLLQKPDLSPWKEHERLLVLIDASRLKLSSTQMIELKQWVKVIQLLHCKLKRLSFVLEGLRQKELDYPLINWALTQLVEELKVIKSSLKSNASSPIQLSKSWMNSFRQQIEEKYVSPPKEEHHLLWLTSAAIEDVVHVLELLADVRSCCLTDSVKKPVLSEEQNEEDRHRWASLRIAFTLFTAVAFSQVAHFPGGGLQVFIAAGVIILQPDIGSSTRQAWFRLLGVVLGGAMTITVSIILWQISHFWLLAILYGWPLFFATYFNLKYPSYSYIFLQAGIVLTLVLTSQEGPYLSLSIFWERLLGVFEGFCIAIFFTYLIAPVSPFQKLFELGCQHLNNIGTILHGCFTDGSFDMTQFHDFYHHFHEKYHMLLETAHYELGLQDTEKKKMETIFKEIESIYSEVSALVYGMQKPFKGLSFQKQIQINQLVEQSKESFILLVKSLKTHTPCKCGFQLLVKETEALQEDNPVVLSLLSLFQRGSNIENILGEG